MDTRLTEYVIFLSFIFLSKTALDFSTKAKQGILANPTTLKQWFSERGMIAELSQFELLKVNQRSAA